MTAERHELHELVDELSEDQVAVVLADVRRRLRLTEGKAWSPKFFGMSTARTFRPIWPRTPSTTSPRLGSAVTRCDPGR